MASRTFIFTEYAESTKCSPAGEAARGFTLRFVLSTVDGNITDFSHDLTFMDAEVWIPRRA